MCVIQGMYSNTWSQIRVNGQYSDVFGMGVDVLQGTVLSPLLDVLVLEVPSRGFSTGVPWELLHTDDLVLIADTQENCIYKLKAWKTGMDSKGLHINMMETKFLVSGVDHDVLKKSGKYPCAACSSGVDNNSIQCSQCIQWVHKKCSGITKWLVDNLNYVCRKCKGGDRSINGRTVTEVDVDGTMLDVEATFCNLGDILCSGDSAIAARCCVAWGKLRKVMPFLITRYLSPSICGKVYDACVHRNNTELQRHLRNDRAMIRWICSMKDRYETLPGSLLQKLGIKIIKLVLRCQRLSPVSNLSQAFRFPALETYEGVGRHGLNVWRLMSMCRLAGIDPLRDAWRAHGHKLALPTPWNGTWTTLKSKNGSGCMDGNWHFRFYWSVCGWCS